MSPEGAILWTKNRGLLGNEIVETVKDRDRRPVFTIHKPTRGWYLVIRSPNWSDKAFVSLRPSTLHSPSHLKFALKTDVHTQPKPTTDGPSQPTLSRNPSNASSSFLIQPHLPSHAHRKSSNSFSLSSFTSLFVNRGKTFSITWENEADAEVIRFEDDTGMLATATSGNLFMDEELISSIAVDRSFWICVALAYIEFAEDSEAYKAASEDII